MKNILANTALVLVSVAVFIGALEFVLRITGIQRVKPYTPPIYQSNVNPDISYELKPSMKEHAFRSTITTNTLGFRSEEVKPDTLKVVFLGDSITFGYGVEDEQALPAQVQKELSGVQVLNAAVPGYNIVQQRATYEEKIAPLAPDIFVLVFYWNDFEKQIAFLDEDNVLRPEGYDPSEKICNSIKQGILAFAPGQCWLNDHSAIYKFIRKVANTRTGFASRDAETVETSEEEETDISQADLDWYARELRKIDTQDIPHYFVIWPDHLPHTESRKKLTTLATRLGYTVIDLYEALGTNPKTLSWDYVHPHADTISQAAKIIADVMKSDQ